MAVYNFTFTPPQSTNFAPNNEIFTGEGIVHPNRLDNLPDLNEEKVAFGDDANVMPEKIIEVINKGFYILDEGMKNWLTGFKVPTLDGYKSVDIYIASSDIATLVWAKEFFNGRVALPVISLKRTTWNFDKELFTPPYRPYDVIPTDPSGKNLRLVYRPVPYKVSYELSIWCEFKRDAEYIWSMIVNKCNPMAEFEVEDQWIQQIVRVRHNGVNNRSDVDLADVKTRPKVIYDIALTADFTLPTNEDVVPAILGKVATLEEMNTGELFDVYRIGDLRGGIKG